MRLSAIAPVLNEVDFIGYSILSCLEDMHEFIYALDGKSEDGTRELLWHIKDKYAHEKLIILETPTFDPHETAAYNDAFDRCLEKARGEAVMFYHPDQIILNPEKIRDLRRGPLAWTTNMISYAGDFQTQITKGRAQKWKNIHAKEFGLVYRGAYGSQNEDFYHTEITGGAFDHFGMEFLKYPYEVAESHLNVNHYCECKSYARRLEKMKICLKTQNPKSDPDWLETMAAHHPRVTLEPSEPMFGEFEFTKTQDPIPEVFSKYKEEFESFKKQEVLNGI